MQKFLLIIIIFLSLTALYSIFYKSSFTLKLDSKNIEFQNRDISLISLGKRTKHLFFCMKRAFAHFGPPNCVVKPILVRILRIYFWLFALGNCELYKIAHLFFDLVNYVIKIIILEKFNA